MATPRRSDGRNDTASNCGNACESDCGDDCENDWGNACWNGCQNDREDAHVGNDRNDGATGV